MINNFWYKKSRMTIHRLKDMLQWSQRIGSDEISEMHYLIKILKEDNNDLK